MSILDDFKEAVGDLLKTNRFAVEFPQRWKMHKNHWLFVDEVKGLELRADGRGFTFAYAYGEQIQIKLLMGTGIKPSIFSALSKIIKKYNEPDHSCLVSDECHCPSNNFKLGEDYLFIHQLDNEGSSVYKFKIKVDGIILKFPKLNQNPVDSPCYATLYINSYDTIEIVDC
jgi:hypothetical protein